MPEQLIRQCLHDENKSFGTLHSLPDGHDPYFEPLPMKVAACRSCTHPTLEDVDDEGPSCQVSGVFNLLFMTYQHDQFRMDPYSSISRIRNLLLSSQLTPPMYLYFRHCLLYLSLQLPHPSLPPFS